MSHPDEIDALLGIESAYAETVQRHYHERIAGFALAERIRELTDPNDPGEHIIDRMRLALAEYEHLSHGFTWAMGDKELPSVRVPGTHAADVARAMHWVRRVYLD